MNVARWSVSLVAIVGLVAATVAGATVWLLVSDPASVATAVSSGDVTPIMRAIGTVIFGALRDLFRYL